MTMSESLEFILRAVVVGVGATLVMDLWALGLKQFGVPSLNFAFLGRWIGHFVDGQFKHNKIADALPVRGERFVGWVAHYSIGVAFSLLLFVAFGVEWARAPSLVPALVVGLVTATAPLFVLQPALGAGIASSKTPRPVFNTAKSLVTHTVYGFGLYLTAVVAALALPVGQ
jgi:hypothetical protein